MIGSVEEFQGQEGLVLAKMLVNPNKHCIPLRLANFNDKPVQLLKHTSMGHGSPIAQVTIMSHDLAEMATAPQDGSLDEDEVPLHLKALWEECSEGLEKS